MEILGVDIGGSGIKAAPVDTSTGALIRPRRRLDTPNRATPSAVVELIREIADGFAWEGAVGCAFPGPVIDSTVMTAVNLDQSWVGLDGAAVIREEIGLDTVLVNDADATGIAEARMGAGAGHAGTIVVLTFGTGIGSALVIGGVLVANTELGEVPFASGTAEQHAAARVRAELGLSDERWASRVSDVLRLYEDILYPELFVIGGGISARWHDFAGFLSCRTPVVPAKFAEDAGIVGAALYAADVTTTGGRPPSSPR